MAFVPVVLWDKTTYRDKKGLIRLNVLCVFAPLHIVKHIIRHMMKEVYVDSTRWDLEFSFMKANAKRYKMSIN
jgi:hypothetical protein